MSKRCMSIDIASTTFAGKCGQITLYLTDENGEQVAFTISKQQAEWLRYTLKYAIELRKQK